MRLRSLGFDLAQMPILSFQTLLPELQELSVSFTPSTVPVNLAWLHAQPCVHLKLGLSLCLDPGAPMAEGLLQYSQAVQQIQQLQVQCLTL